jgi:MFS family permease
MYKHNVAVRGFLPILSYSLSSFFLLGYIFYMEAAKFPTWISVILIGIPFIGRMVTPFVYSRLTFAIGVERSMILSLIYMSLISVIDTFILNYSFLVATRFILGVLFGISTSASIELASLTEDKKIVGLTMAGWAFGWIISVILFESFGSYMFIPGLVTLSLLLLRTERYSVSKVGKISFSWKAFSVFFLGFVPAYVMQLVPSMLGSEAFLETIVGYSLSIFAYLFLPMVKRLTLAITVVALIIVSTAVLGFSTLNLALLSIFTMFGLGLNSLLPIISRMINVEPWKIGPSMNLASFGGLLFPEIISITGDEKLSSTVVVLVTTIAFLLLVFKLQRTSIKSVNRTLISVR